MYIKKKKKKKNEEKKNWKFYFISQLKSTIVIAFNIYFLASSYRTPSHPIHSYNIRTWTRERERESERERRNREDFCQELRNKKNKNRKGIPWSE